MFVLTLLIAITTSSFAQSTGDFRTAASGSWTNTTTWQRYNGAAWVSAASVPDNTSGLITILLGHTVTLSANKTIDELTINAGGVLTVDTGFTVSMAGNTVLRGTLTVNGKIDCGSYVFSSSGTFILSAGATIYIGSATGIATTGASGNVQTTTRSYSADANYIYNGAVGQVTGTGLPLSLNGNLTITNNTASGVTLSNSYAFNSPSIFNVTGVLNASTRVISGTGTFTLASGATLITLNAAGITSSGATGSVQTTIRNFSSAANYSYSGTAAQSTGTGLPSTLTGIITINNTHANGVTLSGSYTLNSPGVMTASKVFKCGIYNISGTGTFTLDSGASLYVGSANGLDTSSGNIQTTVRNMNVATNYIYYGTIAQIAGNGLPSLIRGNVTISTTNASGVTLSRNLTMNSPGIMTVGGVLNASTYLISGTGSFVLNAAATLMIASADGISSSGSTGNIQTTTRTFNADAIYKYTGTSAQVTGSGLPTSLTRTLTFANTNPAGLSLTNNLTLGAVSSITVSGVLNMGTKLINGAGAFTLSATGTLIIGSADGITTAGTALGNIQTTTRTLNAGATYIYNGATAQVTGTGLPTTMTGIVNLNNNTSGGVTLTKSHVFNGAGTMNVTGVFMPGAFNITGSGTFNLSSTATMYIYNAAGITSSGAAGQVQTTIRSFDGAATYIYNGVALQNTGTGLPATLTGRVTITNAAGATLSASHAVNTPAVFQVNSSLRCGTNVLSGTGSFILDSAATLYIGSATGIASSGSTGNIQTSTRNFHNAANYNYNGAIAQVTGDGLPSGLTGNITVSNTHASGLMPSADMTITSPTVMTVTGIFNTANYTVSGTGTFTLSSTGGLIIGSANGITSSGATGNIQTTTRSFASDADYTYSSTSAQVTGDGLPSPLTGNLTFSNTNSGGLSLNRNLTINSPGIVSETGVLNCGTYVIGGSGTFTLTASGNLMIGSVDGITTGIAQGNIQTTTRTFPGTATYTYNGVADQAAGNGLPTTITGTLNLNTNTTNGVTIANNYVINTPGAVNINGVCKPGAFRFSGTGTCNLNSGATLYITVAGGITSSGATGPVQTSTRNFDPAANYIYSGIVAQSSGSGLPATLTGNLTVTNTHASGLTLSGSYAVNSPGTFRVSTVLITSTNNITGTGTFTLDSLATLYIGSANGITASGASGNIQTTTRNFPFNATYIFNGASAQVTGNGLPATTNNVDINNAAGVSLSSNLTIGNSLSLTAGVFCLNSRTLTISAGKNITRTAGSMSLCGGSVSFSGSGNNGVNLTYSGAVGITTGPEVPTSATALRTLTINNSGGVTLGANLTINRQLIMTRGLITAGAFVINYASGSSLLYNGTITQAVRNIEWPSTFDKDITISNSAAAGIVLNANKTAYTGHLTVNNVFNPSTFVIQGSGSFTLASGATFITPNVQGLASNGSIQLSGGRSYSTGANYTFNGVSAQVTGSDFPASANAINVSNASGLSLTSNTVVKDLTLTNGALTIGSHGLTVSGDIFVVSGTITGSSTSDMSFTGSGNASFLPTISGGLRNLTVNRGNGIILAANTTIGGTLALTNGSLDISNFNLVLNGALTIGSGDLTGSTTSSLTVSGSGSHMVLPSISGGLMNLVIDRTSGISLGGGLSIANSVTLTDGSITLGDYNLTLQSSAVISGYNANNYIVTTNDAATGGSLIMQVSSSVVVFPVGTNTFNPVTLRNTGTVDNFYVRVFDDVLTSGNTGERIPNLKKVVNKTWLVEEMAVGGSNVDMSLTWNSPDEDQQFDSTSAVIWHYTSGAWDRNASKNVSMVHPGTHKATRNNITSFSPFTVGDDNTPLPVDLLAFNATKVNAGVETTWATAQELNNNYFNVERSADGIHFSGIGEINGAGTSATKHEYAYTDRMPLSGVSYYRLKQTDYNGVFTYSNIVRLNNNTMLADAGTVFPNPFRNDIAVKYKGENGAKTEISLADQTGRIIFRQELMNSGTENQFRYNTSDLPKGIYLLYIRSGADVAIHKLTREE